MKALLGARYAMSLRFITLNTGLYRFGTLNWPIYAPVPHAADRLPALAKALSESQADIIALQEIFTAGDINYLHEELGSSYHCLCNQRTTGWVEGGVVVFSKYPAASVSFYNWKSDVLLEKVFGAKGFQHVELSLPNDAPLHLINLHAVAGGFWDPESDSVETVRHQQFEEVLDVTKTAQPHPTVVLGDFNAGPKVSECNYQQFLEAGFRDCFSDTDEPAYTWDPKNALIGEGPHKDCPPQRIDHIFAQNIRDVSDSQICFDEPVLKTKSQSDQMIPISDHYGLMSTLELG